jgi:hypothetical protein
MPLASTTFDDRRAAASDNPRVASRAEGEAMMPCKKLGAAVYPFVIIAWFLSLGPMGSASAQATNQQVAAVRKNFDDCFYSSVAGQLKISRTTDYNMVSENAFRACSTEEQALAVLMTAYNVRSDAIAAVLIKIKLDLKKSIRDIAANPNKYR